MLKSLEHPNIVKAHDMYFEAGQLYTVLEKVHGVTLDSYVEKNGPLPVEKVTPLVR